MLKRFATMEMIRKAMDYTRKLGRAGHAARGIVFGMIGAFVIIAAIQHDP